MSNGCGVSIAALPNGNVRVRWRERVSSSEGIKSKQRERVVSSEAAAVELRTAILRAIEVHGHWEDPVRVEAAVPTLESLAIGYFRHRVARGFESSTIETDERRLRRAFALLRHVSGLPEKAPIPASELNRRRVSDLIIRGREEGLADSTLRHAVRLLLDCWAWSYDDADGQTALPAPPRNPASLLPREGIRVAPEAPTLAELDACVRHVNGSRATPATIVMRYTGLRIAQVLAALRCDLDASALTFRVRTGKSQREKAERRVIPISRYLLDDLAPYLGDDPEGPLFRRRTDWRAKEGAAMRQDTPWLSVRAAWERATQAGEVRKHVWHPERRKIGRPDHAFRAGFQHFMVENGVRDEIIDALVGHAGKSTRAKHYVAPEARMRAMREAVDLLPPIDWLGTAAKERPNNVVPLRG